MSRAVRYLTAAILLIPVVLLISVSLWLVALVEPSPGTAAPPAADIPTALVEAASTPEMRPKPTRTPHPL